MSAASRDKLSLLHDKLADKMAEMLDSEDLSPATLSAVAKFLKDNGIEAVATPGSKVAGLAEKLRLLPFPTSSTGTDG